jgi:subtilase family serine protease
MRLVICLALALAVAAVVIGSAGVGRAQARKTVNIPWKYQAHPPKKYAFPAKAQTFPYTPSECVARYGLACYSPRQIRNAYNIPKSLKGRGQSIVIFDAFGSPSVRRDLNTFSRTFNLPKADLHIYYPQGKPKFNPNSNNQQGWAQEIELDTQWAHAIAPKARINLVIARNNSDTAFNYVQTWALSHNLGHVWSQSYGTPEAAIKSVNSNVQLRLSHDTYANARGRDISVFASAGDSGAGNGFRKPNALYPASDPLVTAVGGTNLFASDRGDYRRETVWNDSDPALCPFGCVYGPFGATGGAPSRVFEKPAYQRGFQPTSHRTTSDVAYDASVYTSVLVYLSIPGIPKGFYFFGGTSAGAPQWAGIGALANQAAGRPLGFLNPRLYKLAKHKAAYRTSFHDVTRGNNAFYGRGYRAKKGYDLPTGLGTPKASALIRHLAR